MSSAKWRLFRLGLNVLTFSEIAVLGPLRPTFLKKMGIFKEGVPYQENNCMLMARETTILRSSSEGVFIKKNIGDLILQRPPLPWQSAQ